MLEDIILQDVASTVYEPDTDVDLPGSGLYSLSFFS